jgi:hypothetical protein
MRSSRRRTTRSISICSTLRPALAKAPKTLSQKRKGRLPREWSVAKNGLEQARII